ncbi:MAG: M1 family metallopeptidase, partial [Ignavibacteriae bacterium]|nr:M1 family metallopeptidase [Ignavibacteriota bacterium]
MNNVMMRVIVACCCLLCFAPRAEAQAIPQNEKFSLEEAEARSASHRQTYSASALADTNVDVTYYKLDLRITTSPNYLRGKVTVHAKSIRPALASVSLDLTNTLTVDSVKLGGSRLQFIQHPAAVAIQLNRSYGHGEMVVLDVFYRGTPVSTGFGTFEFGEHLGTPWVWSLSEPYGARDWWPCKDHPMDKADSVDVWVTCRNDFKVASNGKLVAIVSNPDSTHTYQWSERYPITTYLVFMSLTNYATFTDWFRYSPTDSMPVINYVLPENLADARDSLSRVIDMLRIFSDRLGLYPFVTEKFGHAEFGRGGAMEHQTMTSLVRYAFGEYVLAHELAHQWFGDLVTCASWRDLWINEGFAAYGEVIYAEGKYGVATYHSRARADMESAKTGVGPVYKSDTTNLRQLFDQPTVYRKGLATLHMLRHVVGDSLFFRSLRSFLSDPRYRFGVATTENFKDVCEVVSGRQLDWFFDQWIYGEKYPRYSYTWQAIPDTDGGYIATISLSQTTGTSNPAFFTMPIDFKISSASRDTTVVLL